MKATIYGWVSKTAKDISDLQSYESAELLFDAVFKNRGKKKEWMASDWPPKKVKITIEIL